MLKKSRLPLLPGYTIDAERVFQQHFHKSQRFMVQNETCMLSNTARPSSEGDLIYEEGQVPPAPKNHWLLYDRQVLQFDAYFKDPEKKRKCKLFYYLEDDTMQVVEPKEENSGCYQGTFIHRHRIPLPSAWKQQHSNAACINTTASQASGYYSIAHLNVGKIIELYGRQFTLLSCDRFTRLLLQKLGAFVPENQEPFVELADESKTEIVDKHVKVRLASQRQFLMLDGLVLKFAGYWDDRQSESGRLHRLILLYYLADDTLEVRFDSGAILVKRGRMSKSGPIVTLGPPDQIPVLNVMRGQFLMDASPSEGCRIPCEFMTDSDLGIGKVINVFGRQVVLTSCDLFTQKFYRSKYGIEDFTPLATPYDEDAEEVRRVPAPPLPPYNGFGTFEDSAANCKSIVPVPPKRNFLKFLMKDRQGMDSHVLRFAAQLCGQGSDPRKFVISFYLSDDTISIHEETIINSGYAGGRFLERCRLLKPRQDIFKVPEPLYYGPADFYVGAEICANDFKFQLTGADEYALDYMEKNYNEFPKSNATIIINRVREALKDSYKDIVAQMLAYDPENTGTISSFKLRDILEPALADLLTEQEYLTLLRRFASPQQQPPDLQFRCKVHSELRRQLFHDVDLLRVELRCRDPEQTGYVSRTAAWGVCRSLPVPLSSHMISRILDKVKSNDKGDLYYEDLVYFLDVENQPANLEWQDQDVGVHQVNCDHVNYLELIKDLKLEQELVQQTT